MKSDLSILVAVQFPSHECEEVLGDKCDLFRQHLRDTLRKSGFEDKASSPALLLFRFERLVAALITLYEALDTFRSEKVPVPASDPLPVRYILHFITKRDEVLPAFCELGAALWNSLEDETLYVTRSLKLEWQELLFGKDVVDCNFKRGDQGLFQVDFLKKPDFSKVRLFQYRHLPLQGSLKECFYCGMRSHVPGQCPSKFLNFEHQSIQELGYLSFPEINEVFKHAFQNPQAICGKLEPDITLGELKKNKELLVYVSYLDVFRLFQPRSFFKVAFSPYSKWQPVNATTKIVIDDANLHFGYDCLRVGKYDEAEEKFLEATGHQHIKAFYGYVGLAFVALERGRVQDMGHFLDTAYSNAVKEKEKIYINLLLCRYYQLTGDPWKAQNAANNLMKLQYDFHDGRYLLALIEMAGGFSEKAMVELRTLLVNSRIFFMVLLLDPQLLPFHGFVDEILQAKLEMINREAEQQLALARDAVYDLEQWLGKEAPRFQDAATAMEALENHFAAGNVNDLLDVGEKGRRLCDLCKAICEECLDELALQKNDVQQDYEAFVSFWQVFLYRGLFHKAFAVSKEVKDKLIRVEECVKDARAETYREAVEMLPDLELERHTLVQALKQMRFFAACLFNLKVFAKKLIIAEAIVLALTVLLSFSVLFFPELAIFTDTSIQQQVFLSLTLVLAPGLALSMTLYDLINKK